MRKYLVVIIASFMGCAASPPEISNISDYRTYIAKIDETVRSADADSFVDNERAEILANIESINGTLGNVATFEELEPENQETLAALHIALHEKIIGLEESRTGERICRTQSVTNSHIGSRVCRTRGQMTSARVSARDYLRSRSDAIDNVFFTERMHPNETIGGRQRDY